MAASLKIYPFEMKDYDLVYQLWLEVFPETTDASYDREAIQFFLDRNPGTSFVAELDGEVVGALLAGHDGRRGYIHHLGVRAELRGTGIGKELIRWAEEALAELGLEKVHLFVIKSNTPAKAFYEKIGYEQRNRLDIFSRVIKK